MRHAHRSLVAVITLVGCSTSNSADRDGDGTPNFDDCQPDDPTSYPGAPEICDGVDNDCDTRIDNGLNSTFYADTDGDGFGDPDTPVLACEQPLGAVLVADDCDDGRADVHPGAVELCDGRDNDCDELVDEARAAYDFQGIDATAGLALTGEAGITRDTENTGNDYLRIAPSSINKQGGVWWQTRVPASLFRVRFRARMASVGFTDGEGMALVVVKDDVETAVGRAGRDLGIYGADVAGYTLELDPYRNDPDDTTRAAYHVAVHEVQSGLRLTESETPPYFPDGRWHTWEVTFRGPLLTVTYDDTVSVFDTTPLAIGLGDAVTIGFTAATSERTMQFGIDDLLIGCPDVDLVDTGL